MTWILSPLLLLLTASLNCAEVIRVHGGKGKDSESCLHPSNGNSSCKTLDYALQNTLGKSNVTIYVNTRVTLKRLKVFEDVNNITISGSDPNEKYHKIKAIQCSENTGLTFSNVSGITISHLEFKKCGAYDNESRYRAAMIFKRSMDLYMLNTTISKAHLTGIALLNCSGTIGLSRVYFYSNGYNHNYSCVSYPAGVSIEIMDPMRKASYSFKNCRFKGNKGADYPCRDNISRSIYWHGEGIGGGLGIAVRT